MFGVAIIVFRETLEAALFVGIIAAATRGLLGRGWYLTGGVLAGAAGALALAAGAEHISVLADGIGQDLVNSAILSLALAMLIWHCVWVSNQGAKAAADARALGNSFERGQRKPWALLVVVALSVLREGAETVLFVTGYAGGPGQTGTLAGSIMGVLSGTAVGLLLYIGLSHVPVKRMFTITNFLVQLLAASIASQLARALAQAGLLNQWGQTLWDTSNWLSMESPIGTLAHALAGYEAQPTGLQVAFYLLALFIMISGTRWVKRAQSRARGRTQVRPVS
jgi:high-affinity iron transporter